MPRPACPRPSLPSTSSRRRFAGLTAVLTVLAATLAMLGGTADAEQSITRVFGADRYQTAVAINQRLHPSGPVATLLVATGEQFPDALVAGPVAVRLGAALLLVPSAGTLPPSVHDEILRLAPRRVILLGGPQAVSVQTQLDIVRAAPQARIDRVSGLDRYDTAAQLSRDTFPSGVDTAYVATGASFPDALAAGGAAGHDSGPVLLTAPDALPPVIRDELTRLRPAHIVLVGGTSAASQAVEQTLRSLAPDVTRVFGPDRFTTAAAVANRAYPQATGTVLATGATFPDALVGGPLAAKLGAPVLLSLRDCVPNAAFAVAQRLGYPPLTLLGGPVALGGANADLVPCNKISDGEIGPGVVLQTLRLPGPNLARVVTIDLRGPAQVTPVLAQDRLPGLETTTSMARRSGALVAVNADYALDNGRPVHAFARDGRLAQTPQLLGRDFGLGTDRVPHLGFPTVNATLEVVGSPPPGQPAAITIDRVNSAYPLPDEAAAYTSVAGALAPPPRDTCAVRLRPDGPPTLVDGRAVQRETVEASACGADPMPLAGGDVVVAPVGGGKAGYLQALRPGTPVEFGFDLGWPNLLHAVGGNPTLMENGQIIPGNVDGSSAYFGPQPRTGIGYTADSKLLIVTVDGRARDESVGLSLRAFAELFASLGATDALNLDGGGSTAMVVDGALQNRPSDGFERGVSSALVVTIGGSVSAGAGSGSAQNAQNPHAQASAVPPDLLPPDREAADEAAIAADPGSTGGFLDAVRRGELGG